MGKNITSDVFALYLDDFDKYIDNYPKEEFVAMEVEAFCIFFQQKKYKIKWIIYNS